MQALSEPSTTTPVGGAAPSLERSRAKVDPAHRARRSGDLHLTRRPAAAQKLGNGLTVPGGRSAPTRRVEALSAAQLTHRCDGSPRPEPQAAW